MTETGLLKKFLDSLVIGREEWHDGIGYDLDALRALTGPDRDRAEEALLSRRGTDWRDMEALAALGTPKAIEALRKFLRHGGVGSRLSAAVSLHELGALDDLGPILDEALRSREFSVFSRALDLVGEHKPSGVEEALLELTRRGNADRAVNAAAMLYFLRGQTSEPFDWSRRPFFLKFAETGPERQEAFKELCATLKVYPR